MCLGGLTNLANALEMKPEFHEKIARIVWYNDSIDPLSGTNFEFDKKAVHSVFSIDVALEAVSNNKAEGRVISQQFLQNINDLNSPYAEMIASTQAMRALSSG